MEQPTQNSHNTDLGLEETAEELRKILNPEQKSEVKEAESDLDNLLKQHEKFIMFSNISLRKGCKEQGSDLTAINFDKTTICIDTIVAIGK